MPAPFLNLLVLRAPDIEAAQRFYSLLGFSFTRHAHGTGPQHYAAESGAQVFEIYPQTSADDATKSVRLGFKVPALDATVTRLIEGGATLISAPKDSPWGRRAVIADPIGHKIELIEEKATSETLRS
jgi:predicted enzyme related to lactoylglutathione lyase